MPRLMKVRRKPAELLALIHEEPITMQKDGQPTQGRVQVIDDRVGEGDDSWLLRDEKELWAYYDEAGIRDKGQGTRGKG